RLLYESRAKTAVADVAQSAELRFCKPAVVGSIPTVSSGRDTPVVVERRERGRQRERGADPVGYPSGQREQTVNLPAHAFEGSNPSPTMGLARQVGGTRSRGSSSVGRAQAFQA